MSKIAAHRAFVIGWSALPITLLVGCVKQTTDGAETTFRYEYWYPLAFFLGGIAVAPLGWMIRRRLRRIGSWLVLAGLVSALGLAPMLLGDRVWVTDEGFRVRTGFWGATANVQLRYDEIRSARFISEAHATRSGPRSESFLVCELKTGGSPKIPAGHDLVRAAIIPIRAQLAARGIPILNEDEAAN